MTVIEMDGVNTQSMTVDSIQIFAGQRYSFVVGYYKLPTDHLSRKCYRCKPTNQLEIIGSALNLMLGTQLSLEA